MLAYHLREAIKLVRVCHRGEQHQFVAAGVGVYRVEPHEPTLEDVYFALQAVVPSTERAA